MAQEVHGSRVTVRDTAVPGGVGNLAARDVRGLCGEGEAMSDGYSVEVDRDGQGQAVRLAFGRVPSDAPVSVCTLWRACLVCGQPFARNPRHAKEHLYCSARCRAQHYRASKQRALPGESRVERAFRAWIASEDGRVVEAEVIRRAMLLRSRGIKRYGIASLWESIRYDAYLSLKGEAGAWRLNNSYRSLLARKVMADVPQLAGFFSVRDLRGRVA